MHSTRRKFLKQIGLGSVGFSLIAALPTQHDINAFDKKSLPRSIPEMQGVSSAGISAFLDEVAKSKIEFHSIMVLRHGYVIAEGWWSPYAAPLKHALYSLSKSFTSTAVGLAVSEGLLSIEADVLSFFPKEKPTHIDPKLASMKVKHLLTMSTGHVKDTIQPMRNSTDSWAKTFLSLPIEREPGTFFLYNTGATYILSAIVQKVTGKTLLQYLRPRILDPLGIEGEDWETDPQGINTGGYGLRVKTEDIAKFGQLYLQKGKWNNQQILSPSWVEEATRVQIESNSSKPTRPKDDDDWAQGYGYKFWRCRPGGYRADGAFGQFCMVMPEYDAVIAITSESFSMQNSMDLVWSHLLPTMDTLKKTLPLNSKAEGELKSKLRMLTLEPPKQNATSPFTKHVSGKEFILDPNEFKARTIRLDFKDGNCKFILNDEKGTHYINCGINKWIRQKNENKGTPFPVVGRMDVPTAIAGSATWSNDKTLLMTWRLIEAAHTNGLTFTFEGNSMIVKFHNSISQSNPKVVEKRSDLQGTMM